MSIFKKSKRKSKITKLNQVFKYDLSSFEETLVIPMFVCKIIGIRLTREESDTSRFWWNMVYWVEAINIFAAAWLELINLTQTAMEGSLVDLFKMLPCIGYLILALAKSYKIVYYRPVFEGILQELRDMWPARQVIAAEHQILTTALRRLRYVCKGYYWCNVALSTVFTSRPYIRIVRRLFGEDVPLILSFFYWLPFNPFQRGYYETLLVLQTWHCFLTIGFMLAGDLTFCVILSHIATQFDLLSVRISSFVQVPVDNQLVESYPLAEYSTQPSEQHGKNMIDGADDARETKQLADIANMITRHQALIRLSRRVEEMFSFSLLLNFVNSSFIICFCGFCCVFVEKWNEMEYKMFLATAIAQIWLLCWYGQRLIDSSKGVSDALYNSGWYLTPQKIKKCILIMIHRSQFELHVTTYGFSIVSLASFSTIIKTSWSYFTLLIKMYK